MLAFDPDAGTIAFVDVKGFPGRIDLRETDVGKASKAKLTSLSSANGTDIYGVNAKGEIVRLNPNGGDWHFKPPVPARTVFAQPNGELVVAANKGAQTLVWKVRPPDDVIQDSTVLPLSGRAVSTQMGDRVYFTVDSGLVESIGAASELSGAPLWGLHEPVVSRLCLDREPWELENAFRAAIGDGARIAAIEIGKTRDLTNPLDLVEENFPYLRP